MADNVFERAVVSEPHPKIHSIPVQSIPARKHSPIPGFMASTDLRLCGSLGHLVQKCFWGPLIQSLTTKRFLFL